MENLQTLLNQVRIPDRNSKVYKNECTYTFETPESPNGLYVDMSSFLGFSKDYVMLNFKKTGHHVYLHIKRTKILKEEMEVEKEASEPPKKKPTVLGVGVTGGFELEESKFDYQDTYSIVILPEFKTFPYPDVNLPEKIQQAVTGILTADAPSTKEEAASWTEELKESKFAKDLPQLNNGVKIPPNPSQWKCSRCDLKENLWLNLTDGTMLCGRRNWDGSGGNGHALEYFQQTGYPLCVKLGTISADGKADVFSYAEDDSVLDPYLAQHLAHFGINVNQMEKTEKTTAELQIDMNLSYDWSRLQEQDKVLKPMYGPGLTGMKNIGNSCYLASVIQTVFSIPEFQERYFSKADQIFENASADPTSDFQFQMSKLAKGLLSGNYSVASEVQKDEHEQPIQPGIAPRTFKSLIGKGHPEFSTSRQQDALEFFQYLLETVERDERKHHHNLNESPVARAFKFEVEERMLCTASEHVRYNSRVETVLSLPIPLEKATNLAEFHEFEKKKKEEEDSAKKEGRSVKMLEPVRPRIPFSVCLETWAAPEETPDFYSSAIHAKTMGIRRERIGTFPDYLMIQLRKFYVGEDWTPRKLEAFVDVPEELDLEPYRGTGLQPGEKLLPDEPESQKNSGGSGQQQKEQQIVPDEMIIIQLMEMGFSKTRCEKAAYHTKNAGVEEASNWLFTHMEDPDIDEPLKLNADTSSSAADSSSSSSSSGADEESIAMLMSMGFPRETAERALKATQNNLERATEWIFSHADDPIEEESSSNASSSSGVQHPPKPDLKNGPGKYRLKAIISHMGSSAMSGHYVCHIKKDGKWVLFNDNKVALSEDPPKDMGYLYLFERAVESSST